MNREILERLEIRHGDEPGPLAIFIGIVDSETWRRWRGDKDFCGIVTRVESVIRDQRRYRRRC